MELVLIIMGGIVIVTLISAVGDYLKSRLASKGGSPSVEALEQRVAVLEEKLAAQEQESARLSQELAFTTKLLEKKLTP